MTKGKITPNNILHFNKQSKKEETADSDEITVENLIHKASSDNVADAMKNLYGTYGLVKHVKALDDSYKVSGFVRTVETNSNDWGTCITGIYACQPDEILFIKCSDDEYAVWGELASSAAKKHGVKATVIVGASRDKEDILKLGFPVFSSGTMSRAGLPLNEGIVGEKLIINDFIVKTGDFAICDADGVVIVPGEKLEEVLGEVNKIKEFENNCLKQLYEDNLNLDDILGLK